MNLTLAQIISTDPDARGYATMTDGQIIDDLHVQRHPARRKVPFQEFNKYLFDNGIATAIITAKLNPSDPANATAVLVTDVMNQAMNSGLIGVDMDSTSNQSLFAAMQTAGLLTGPQLAALDAMADVQISLAELNQLQAFTLDDIAKITGGTN